MFGQIKKMALRSVRVIIAMHIYDNWKARKRMASGDIADTQGSTHSGMELQASLDYTSMVFEDYLRTGQVSPGELNGATVLEIGPGDNFGVALRFIAAGAKKVVTLDRFHSKRDPAQQKRIYQAMRDALTAEERARFDKAIIVTADGAEAVPEFIQYTYGFGMEEADRFIKGEAFDFIVSRAVLEHFYDPEKAMEVMNGLLKPGGRHLHKVDFTDHKMFSGNGHHPLTFLTIRDKYYALMSRDTGRPNRRLIDFYRRKLSDLGYSFKLFKTHVFGYKKDFQPYRESLEKDREYTGETLELLEKIRPRLLRRYRDLPDSDLMVSGIFMVATKPMPGAAGV